MTFTPADTLIGPVVATLTQIITQQIGGVATFYPTPPANPPDDSSVAFLFNRGKNSTATIGRLKETMSVVLMHFFRFNDIANAYTTCYSYIPSYLNAFEDWANQRLNGTQYEINVLDYAVQQHPYAGQAYLILFVALEIVTELPTPTV